MNDLNDARQWDEMAGHLVQAHGADPNCLIGYAPALEMRGFAHADTHIALAARDLQPPDGDIHSLPLDVPRPAARQAPSYRPFPPSPGAADDPFADGWPMPYQTGISHHVFSLSGREAGIADRLLARQSISPEDLAAARAAARLGRADFPSPVQTRPSVQPGHGGSAASPRRAASTASAARQGRSRGLR
jgi:hypothetical protein